MLTINDFGDEQVRVPIGAIRKAIDNAEYSGHPRFRLGAVIFKGSQIISEGTNDIRSFQAIPDRYVEYSHSLHAELAAILNAERSVKGFNLLVVRIDANGFLRMAKPCEWCSDSIKHFGIRNVYYSNDEGEIIKTRSKFL